MARRSVQKDSSVQSPKPATWCIKKERTTHPDDDQCGGGVRMWPRQKGSLKKEKSDDQA
jgi:hypothetical protein